MSTKIPILKVYDENGNEISIPAIGIVVQTDKTLSIEGKPADAKAVGDALGSYITDIDTLLGGDE